MLIRITLDIEHDEIMDIKVESLKGCPQCGEDLEIELEHEDQADEDAGGVGGAVGPHVVPISSTKSGRDGADSASSE